MNIKSIPDPKETKNLYGLNKYLNTLKNLYLINKFPKVTLLSGKKGIGKSTLIYHLLHFIFDRDNYNEKKNSIKNDTFFNKQFLNDLYPNILHLRGINLKTISIDDIRDLKKLLLKSSIDKKKRFIILDEIELFNTQSLNGLLRIIEEPNENNHFILINGKSKPLIETIKSRCLEINISLDLPSSKEIVSKLSDQFEQKIILDYDELKITPGNFINFNNIFLSNKIDLEDNFLKNLKLLIDLSKKEKKIIYKDLLFFYTDYHLSKMKSKNFYNKNQFLNLRIEILKKLNDFYLYNLSQATLMYSLKNIYSNE